MVTFVRLERKPMNDIDKYKLEKVAQDNLWERITKFFKVKKNIGIKDYCNIYGTDTNITIDYCYLVLTY
jgi:hypothetical protein